MRLFESTIDMTLFRLSHVRNKMHIGRKIKSRKTNNKNNSENKL